MIDNATNEDDFKDTEAYRDSLATVDKSGKRIWIFPKKPKGKFYNYRKIVSYLLLIVLFGLPWLKHNGEPMFLFNFMDGKFRIFGVFFTPQDFHIFVVAMLIGIVFIALFTVVFGRVFCGWICPQTIFMEMVYRRIEYWIEGDSKAQRRLRKAPWDTGKIIKKISKEAIFFGIAVLIANTFLAYFIGMDKVLNIITDPISQHTSGFVAMLVFSFSFYFVFSILREQVCTTICPYGRLQGVLLDKNSLAVQYDFVRGEPRARIKRGTEQSSKGDCIDCGLCVQVCPTGIDIRDGIQLECVNCTACMDACDEVMEKIKRPKGLIRIDSLVGITENINALITPRSLGYSAILVVLMILEAFLFIGRSEVEVLLLRTPGMLYQELEPGVISNLYNYQLINKADSEYDIDFRIENIDEAVVEFVGQKPRAESNENTEGALFIKIPATVLKGRKTKIKLTARVGDKVLDNFSTTFLGPVR